MTEALDDVSIEQQEEIRQQLIADEATQKSKKILHKHRREIHRLNVLAQGAALENNFESYKYAIEKLRGIYRQPFNDELILASWQSTRQTIWNIINDHQS